MDRGWLPIADQFGWQFRCGRLRFLRRKDKRIQLDALRAPFANQHSLCVSVHHKHVALRRSHTGVGRLNDANQENGDSSIHGSSSATCTPCVPIGLIFDTYTSQATSSNGTEGSFRTIQMASTIHIAVNLFLSVTLDATGVSVCGPPGLLRRDPRNLTRNVMVDAVGKRRNRAGRRTRIQHCHTRLKDAG
jgi:hypothetical protein